MGFIQGEGRTQGTLFPVTLDELIPQDHVCRVIDAFVHRLDMAGLGFERAEPSDTGRPGDDPRDLLNSICMVTCSKSAPRGGWRTNVGVTWK
jgi:transposase